MTELEPNGTGSYTLRVVGEVDEGRELLELRTTLDRATLHTTGCLTVDLSEADFISGIGLSLLEIARRDIYRRGGKVALVPGVFAGHILQKMGWIDSYEVVSSRAEGTWYPEMAASA